jgi:hypothetical protein
MRTLTFFVAASALALGACAGRAPQPVAVIQPQDPCGLCCDLAKVLQNPYADRFQKQAALETVRNNGCLGGPPAPKVQIDGQACEAGINVLGNQYADAFMKQAALEILRNKGCFNPH